MDSVFNLKERKKVLQTALSVILFRITRVYFRKILNNGHVCK